MNYYQLLIFIILASCVPITKEIKIKCPNGFTEKDSDCLQEGSLKISMDEEANQHLDSSSIQTINVGLSQTEYLPSEKVFIINSDDFTSKTLNKVFLNNGENGSTVIFQGILNFQSVVFNHDIFSFILNGKEIFVNNADDVTFRFKEKNVSYTYYEFLNYLGFEKIITGFLKFRNSFLKDVLDRESNIIYECGPMGLTNGNISEFASCILKPSITKHLSKVNEGPYPLTSLSVLVFDLNITDSSSVSVSLPNVSSRRKIDFLLKEGLSFPKIKFFRQNSELQNSEIYFYLSNGKEISISKADNAFYSIENYANQMRNFTEFKNLFDPLNSSLVRENFVCENVSFVKGKINGTCSKI